MTNYDVVKKLIGNIRPTGYASIDPKRLENLKAICELMHKIHSDIEGVAYDFRNDYQSTIKESSKYAYDFLDKLYLKEKN